MKGPKHKIIKLSKSFLFNWIILFIMHGRVLKKKYFFTARCDTNRVLGFVQKPHVCTETDGLRFLVIIRQRMWKVLDNEDSAQQSKK